MCAYKPPPKTLPGFPQAKATKPKTPIDGTGNKLRKRWVDPDDGTIYEWDYLHGTVERYDRQGRHLGEYDQNGDKKQGPKRNRRIKP
ncbi:colicin E3/pyocin S6 family cytotoxin [Bradyrhizobium sp. SZCCHNS2005]|uniref:colicin E3/pyocin S6 family cytotoxin n=1 Tax=Bradyrhizobium sp. SZCCHNS2005 TaxID=3057303 RepID=UPI0039647D6A